MAIINEVNGKESNEVTLPLDAQYRKLLLSVFKKPRSQHVKSRKSSITNAFVYSIIPEIKATAEQIHDAFMILQMDPSDLRCAYCGIAKNGWDHLRPIVLKQRPTGYVS